MNGLRSYTKKDVLPLISSRPGEIKLGEQISYLKDVGKMQDSLAPFVIFGIPEDVGVRANYGKPGTKNSWKDFLAAFLNVQHNRFLDSEKILLLGEVDTKEELYKASQIDLSDPNYHEKLGDLVSQIDGKVTEIVTEIVKAGKIPIIIGGGHNNAYGNIKGASMANRKPINVLNIDAHTDLRTPDFRHSGNGFSYAIQEGFLDKYAVLGLHQNYTPEYIFSQMERSTNIHFSLFEDLQKGDLHFHFQKNLAFVKEAVFGLEVDCDAISNFPSSAFSPSGFTLNQVRELVRETGKEKNCSYLHICEGIATDHFSTGKAISFLVSDFLKAQ